MGRLPATSAWPPWAGVTRFPTAATTKIWWDLESFGEISNHILMPVEPFIFAVGVRVVVFG